MSTVQVGFSPAAPGNSVITGVAAGANAAGGTDAEGVLGFVDALLAALAPNLEVPKLNEAVGSTVTSATSAPVPQFMQLIPVDPALEPSATDVPPPPLALPAEIEQLLGDLVDALAALDTTDPDQPVDPALEQKLDDMVEALAEMLGIPMPTPPAIDPAITQAAAGLDPSGDIATDIDLPTDPLPTALPTGQPAAAPQPARTSEPERELLAALGAALPAAPADNLVEDAPSVPTSSAPSPAVGDAESPPVPVDPRLARLVEKLERVADRLDVVAPGLARKLEKLSTLLATPTAETVTAVNQLASALDPADLEALALPHSPSQSRSATKPQPFAAPVLPNPAVVAETAPAETAPQQPAPASQPVEEPAAPIDADPAPAPQPLKSADPAAASAPADDLAPKDRNSFAQHLTDARAEKPATAETQPPPQQVAAVPRPDAALAPRAVHAAYQAPVQQINMGQVAFEVVRQVHQGNNRFQIRLDPPELGRIDVRLQIDGDGNTQARMTVERAETLDLMQRDQRHLEKALAQAGLDASKTTLEFSLRQNPNGRDGFQQQFHNQQQGGQGQPWTRGGTPSGEAAAELPPVTQSYRGSLTQSGVNLFV